MSIVSCVSPKHSTTDNRGKIDDAGGDDRCRTDAAPCSWQIRRRALVWPQGRVLALGRSRRTIRRSLSWENTGWPVRGKPKSEEHKYELQLLWRISYAVLCL